jgi:hypothetical protein
VSTTQKALGAIKTVLTLKEQLDALGRDVAALNSRMSALAQAHGDLRDRVARMEGFIEGAAAASRQRRIEE